MIMFFGVNFKYVLDFLEWMNVCWDKLIEGCLRCDWLDFVGYFGIKCFFFKVFCGFGKFVQIVEGVWVVIDWGEYSVYLDFLFFWLEGFFEVVFIVSVIIVVFLFLNLFDIDIGCCKEVIVLCLLKSCENFVVIFLDSVIGLIIIQRFLKIIILEILEFV